MTHPDQARVEGLIAWLRKRGEPDSGIRYEGGGTQFYEGAGYHTTQARVELHGTDALKRCRSAQEPYRWTPAVQYQYSTLAEKEAFVDKMLRRGAGR